MPIRLLLRRGGCLRVARRRPGQSNYNGNIVLNPSQILVDLGASGLSPCNLQQVSWVIPDGNWSDHAGNTGPGADGGPSWVAAIINAVGGYTNGGQVLPNQCFDLINGQKVPYWQDTVILVTWDDWGGWYDDVLPWNCLPGPGGYCKGYSNGTGQQYVYGFRVPLLVVSAWAKEDYVSGGVNQPAPPYVHDFGSILNFVEYAFEQNGNFLSFPNASTWGISPSYYYADYLAPDGPEQPNCNGLCLYGLSDFFVPFTNQPRSFTPISGWKYDTSCFLNPNSCFSNYPMDPDNDANEDQ